MTQVICNAKDSENCAGFECDHYKKHESQMEKWCEEELECPENNVLCKCVPCEDEESNNNEENEAIINITLYCKKEDVKDLKEYVEEAFEAVHCCITFTKHIEVEK
jgi:hypothetical protein